MSGALYPMPQGMLSDPTSMGLLQAGLGMMSAGGPSKMPVSFGQALGQGAQQGLGAYQQVQQAQAEEAAKQQQQQMQQLLLQLRLADFQRKQQQPVIAPPGAQLFRPGEDQPYHTTPFRPEPTAAAKPPMSRTVQIGEEKVTQEYVNGEWREVGRGPAFAKTVAVPPSAVPAPKPAPAPKAPPGFRFKEDESGELEPIPGGPKDTGPKDAARAQATVKKADTVIASVDEALKQTGFFTTGLTGAVLGKIPGTKAYDLEGTLDTIKANLGFAELQAMRDMSPTGGALGQVAVQELSMLQSTLASLKPGLSRDKLQSGLSKIKTHMENWKKTVSEAQGQAQNFPPPPADAIRRLKMKPSEKAQFDAIFGPGAADRALGK